MEPEFKINLAGRVRNIKLPQTQCLLPLFEAIVNSIQAIREIKEIEEGKIEVVLIREPEQITIDEASREIPSITGFSIEDNGSGFNSENFRHFLTADTSHKIDLGGKGVGRFTWLKAFKNVSISSFFKEEEKCFHREFEFSTEGKGLKKHNLIEATSGTSKKTIVTLQNFYSSYQKNCPKTAEKIGERIIEHCLEFFLFDRMPDVVVHDDFLKTPLDLKKLYEEMYFQIDKPKSLELKGHSFALHQLGSSSASEKEHKLSFCGDRRIVKSEKLSNQISHIRGGVKNEDGEIFHFHGLMTGKFLDEAVNTDRTDFDFFDLAVDEPTFENIHEVALKEIKETLSPFLKHAKDESFNRTKAYVINSAPIYRHLLKSNQSGKEGVLPPPSHTTGHAGPHPAVHELYRALAG